uniref:Uncharacterized protein n=1 Tax=Glycine max TaxID=3847 RepID=A0A0R0IB01_SOYBN
MYKLHSEKYRRTRSQNNRYISCTPRSERGYAAASDASPSMRGGLDSISVMEKGVTKNSSGPSGTSSAWAPDPITGYYRPINHTNEIDPVELRKMLLKHKVRSSPSS